jgi:hypothetical protein
VIAKESMRDKVREWDAEHWMNEIKAVGSASEKLQGFVVENA